MKHFFSKNLKFFGAGGSPKKPDPPPPPVLKPPQLGDLQAISTYEYVESIDLISDGVIDGFVNQNGEYVDDLQIFESIYLNDAPIRQSSNVDSSTIYADLNLNFITTGVTGLFYPSGFSSGFANVSLGELSTISGTSEQNISFKFISGRSQIAQDILDTINNVPQQQLEDAYGKQLKILQSKFNYGNSVDLVKSYLMPHLPGQLDSDYPFFALKLGFDYIVPTGANFNYTTDAFLKFNSDISNYACKNLEIDQLQSYRAVEPPKKINITYFTGYEILDPFDSSTGYTNALNGSAYLFLAYNTETPEAFIYKNSADALINNLSGIYIVSPSSKFNYGNATAEIRNGSENQRPLSLFSKTYLDQQYSQTLRGPFRKYFPVEVVPRTGGALGQVLTQFDDKPGTPAASGIIPLGAAIGMLNYDKVKQIHPALFTASVTEDSQRILAGRLGKSNFTVIRNTISDDGKYYLVTFQVIKGIRGCKLTVQFELAEESNENSFFLSQIIAYRITSGAVKREMFTSTGNVYITSLNVLNYKNIITTGNNKTQARLPFNPFASNAELAAFLRATIEVIRNQSGSEDNRKPRNKNVSFSEWNKEYVALANEEGVPLIHVINNPNVNQVYVSIGVRVLKDTAEKELRLLSYDPNSAKRKLVKNKIDAGNPFPSSVKFTIEAGYQDKYGNEEISWQAGYQIKGFVDSQCVIDIGREENDNLVNGTSLLSKFNRFILGSQTIATPIQLPEAQNGRVRFVRVSRETAESYSSLIKREISVEKVSEIINVPFSYPFSAVCGLKLDARSVSTIPTRSYDARFKKVFVPSNYFPLKPSGKDKRYISSSEIAAFNSLPADSSDRVIYNGNWDGTFKLAWSDNPAWILFDLLINRRYGLGNFISPDQVNYWELYKIARFCDAVDSDGKFIGVQSSDGGLEPRYAFNGVIADKTNVFDALKSIVATFRGNMFYSNSEINFTSDRLKPIMAFFNNANVKDGFFNYNNDRRDLKYNVIEVSYLDRDDLFKEKIEYVEDADDIKEKGILRTEARTFGVTSRAHAKRIGEHILYSTINEDENVAFSTSNEILLCRPGDLISINDEVKTLKRHVGRIIDVNTDNYSLKTNISLTENDFSSSGLSPQISVLIPTGKLQPSDFYNLATGANNLNIADLYQTDVPITVSFTASGTGLIDSPESVRVDYGSVFYVDQINNSGLPLFENIQIGTPCSITIANLQQDIYKIQSIKEINLNEYEVIASKFDTGKFSEIESSESLNDFFQYFSSDRTSIINEGFGYNVYNENAFQITGIVQFNSFTTGNFTGIPMGKEDWSGSWEPVENANLYQVEISYTDNPSKKKYVVTTTGTSIIVDGLTMPPFYNYNYSLKVTPINTDFAPKLIGATQQTGFLVERPIRWTNAFFRRISRQK